MHDNDHGSAVESLPTSSSPTKPPKPTSARKNTAKSRWCTVEMAVYILVVIVGYVVMTSVAINLSQETSPTFPAYVHRLKPGWIFSRRVDDSDLQYRGFRSHIFQVISIYLSLAFSIAFLVILHGFGGVSRLACVLSVNYALTKTLAGKAWSPAVIWALNLILLGVSEKYLLLWRLGYLIDALSWLDAAPAWVLMPRWLVFHRVGALIAKAVLRVHMITSVTRAGPIITFNDFLSQVTHPSPDITVKSGSIYAIRWIAATLLMEVILHYMYVVAIKDARAWDGLTPLQLSMIGYWNLKIVWLKLMIVWRFFRLWAMADGIIPPENMVRCMSNNYSGIGFWRSWHRSYNRWLIRYVYVPLGGNKTGVIGYLINSFIIFTFVAIWHDRELKLLAWGWLIVLFFIPEIIATRVFAKYKKRAWYRHLCAFGGACNSFLMITANLVGFVVGIDGIQYILEHVFTLQSIPMLLTICASIFSGIQIMFEIRETEKRKGLDKRF
ncbi:hypothetical protein SeMB42_g01399 [Synchytrium endobioticum]|uniref:Uncharacterized protein n=1 Tax=Synchytrium endobioticum TaxID=286115 RepID=A0A507DLG9_9FUNG|nr:hypothetical protein SeMB42_g01399 [Synchytrium endobioticum]